MTIEQVKAQLAKFDRLEAQAAEAVKECEARISEGRSDGMLLIEEIVAYYRGVGLKRPGFVDTEDARRKLTIALAEKLIAEPFVAVPTNPTDRQPLATHGIVFENRKHVLLLDQLKVAAEGARQAAREFRAAHVQELREDLERQKMARYREALQGNDPQELLEAQRALGTLPNTALVSEDL